jgi:hypothetical protein
VLVSDIVAPTPIRLLIRSIERILLLTEHSKGYELLVTVRGVIDAIIETVCEDHYDAPTQELPTTSRIAQAIEMVLKPTNTHLPSKVCALISKTAIISTVVTRIGPANIANIVSILPLPER